MASALAAPLMPFLRPMPLPRPSTIRCLLRYSTTTPCRAEDRNLVASRTASPTYPPPSMRSNLRPRESHASHRSSHPKKTRNYPIRGTSHHQPAAPKLIPTPVEPLAEELCAPNLPYFVTRTPSNELPIYTLRKRGGNMLLTRVKKIDGKIEDLRDELRVHLGLGEKEAVINRITNHVVLKGHHRPKVEQFLRERKF
nr:hypothetical protein B0A51_16911 [Rachicladosporium sp. CCFEE 5018]